MVEQSEEYGQQTRGGFRQNQYRGNAWKVPTGGNDGQESEGGMVADRPAIKMRGLPFTVTEDEIV